MKKTLIFTVKKDWQDSVYSFKKIGLNVEKAGGISDTSELIKTCDFHGTEKPIWAGNRVESFESMASTFELYLVSEWKEKE